MNRFCERLGNAHPEGWRGRFGNAERGSALVVVLGALALGLVVGVGFLGFSTRQLGGAATGVAKESARELVDASLAQVLGDLDRECRAGSVEVFSGGSAVRYPATPQSMVPDRSSAVSGGSGTAAAPNLLKQSRRAQAGYDAAARFAGAVVYPQAALYAVPVRASAHSTQEDLSRGGLSAARWNKPMLLDRADPVSEWDETPAVSGTLRLAGNAAVPWKWSAPDWVYLKQDGKNPVTWEAASSEGARNPVLGRYAFQMYDVGGLLDLNVAGYDPDPAVVGEEVAARRGSIGLADLTQLGFTPAQLKKLLAHRNPATLGDPDALAGAPSHGNRYVNFLLNGALNRGFVRVGRSAVEERSVNRAFPSRSAMQAYVRQLGGSAVERAALLGVERFVTHFSRGLEQPGYRPGFYDPLAAGSTPWSPVFVRPGIVPPAGRVDDMLYPINWISNTVLSASDLRKNSAMGGPLPWEMALGNNRGGNDAWGSIAERGGPAGDVRTLQEVINPGFLEVRVVEKADASKAHAFTRCDGSLAFLGEPLVRRRFPLERLAWLTWKGPSAELSPSDPAYNAGGTARAILESFGLTWNKDVDGSYFWAYDHGKKGGIFRLEDLTRADAVRGTPREPDFFELLKAAIGVGSLGKGAMPSHLTGYPWDCATYNQVRDRSSTFQLMEIGANLMDQYDADSFPTLIKLPNPDPSLAPGANRYSPPLFTARGVEDLPYFYRFHWKGIEDAADAPSIPLPAPGGALEITGRLAEFSGDKFRCGTTVLMGFPELWNPHAQPVKEVDAGRRPLEFRVVAASETPRDLLEPPKDPSNALDKGMLLNPKLGQLPTLSSESRLWLQLLNAGLYHFVIRPTGFFGYAAAASGSTVSWLHGQGFNTLSSYMGVNSTNWTWNWPVENLQTGYVRKVSTDYRVHGLFWNEVSFYTEKPEELVLGNRVPNYFLSLAPMWRLPAGLLSDADFPLQPMPANWPLFTPRFAGRQFGPVATLADFPLPGDPTVLYRLNDGRVFGWDAASVSYQEMRWPLSPEVARMFPTGGYMVGGGSLKYAGGKQVPFPFPAYQTLYRALTDRQGLRRELFESNPTQVIPPGQPTPGNGGNAFNNRAVDLRGSELVFSVGSSSLFREPTTLCQPGVPSGSGLAAGTDNFFSGAPYGGSVRAADGTRWVGFSLGELPSQFLVAAKVIRRDKVAVYLNSAVPSLGLTWSVDGSDPAQDLYQNKVGYTYTESSPAWSITPPASDPPRPGPPEFHKMRFFQVPVTVAGLQRTSLTVRVQYKDPLSGRWVTYDERYLDVQNGDNARWSAAPVLGKSEVQPQSLPQPQDPMGNLLWKDNKRTLGWSTPLLTSYDPRTARFGSPMRFGYGWYQCVRGTNAKELQLLNPASDNPWDSGFFPGGDGAGGAWNFTDRPGNRVVDLPVVGTRAQTVTPGWLVPACWNSYFLGSNGPIYKDAYDYAVGNKPPILGTSAQWWAQGRNPLTGRLLYQFPSVNALDYGWYSRLYKPAPAGSLPSSGIKGGTASPDPSIPSFFSNAPESFYADSLRIGDFSENILPVPASTWDPQASYRQAYTDADDVCRRASGGLASVGGYTGGIEGLPLGQGTTALAANRPVVLNRPFRSVGELGTVFRGTPWKNLSFFLPETGDAALLDVFCLSETPRLEGGDPAVVAGKVSLNTRQEPVLRALVAGALKDELRGERFSNAEAAAAARALLDRTTGGRPWQGPLTNLGELAGKVFARDLAGLNPADPVYTSSVPRTLTEPARNPDMQAGKDRLDWHFSGFAADLDAVFGSTRDRKTQRLREATLRALVDGGQTRVWNLMLDLVVQKGRFGPRAGALSDFVRESEARVWVYLAVDRLTGEILVREQEWVRE